MRATGVGAVRQEAALAPLKINEFQDLRLREKWLRSQRDDGRPTEDDIVREHFGLRGEKPEDPQNPPPEANTRRDLVFGWVK
jgi:hypothetical protein